MERLIQFFRALAENNCKEWFDSHKPEWLEIKSEFEKFGEELIGRLAELDPDLKGVTVKESTYRIYRDIRFSKDKSPYKTHIGIYMCPGGKKSGKSGYYLHIEPHCDTYFICTGLYLPEPKVVKSVREEIMLTGDRFQKCLDMAEGFSLDWSGSLKRIPYGWPAESPYADYFKLKDFIVIKKLEESYLTSDGLIERLVEDFGRTVEFNALMNRCFDYAMEEM